MEPDTAQRGGSETCVGGCAVGTAITFLSSALVFGVMGYTAHLGGQIRHPEIRDGGMQATPNASYAQAFRV